jgi:hypothetical protein
MTSVFSSHEQKEEKVPLSGPRVVRTTISVPAAIDVERGRAPDTKK